MGAAAHLGIRVGEYDARIRTFIPFYEEILDAAAGSLGGLVTRRAPLVVDLGVGSGALAARSLTALPAGARVLGIDNDSAMMAMAARRLRGRAEFVVGDFLETTLPACDAVTASFALHHVRTARAKRQLYRAHLQGAPARRRLDQR